MKTNTKQLIYQANNCIKGKILLYYIHNKMSNKKSNIKNRTIKNKLAYILQMEG